VQPLPAAHTERTHPERYICEEGELYLGGVQALVRLPFEQHLRDTRAGLNTATFISGYEGSPLAGYDLELAARRSLLSGYHIVHEPGVNEELAATAVEGSQLAAERDDARYDGVLGIWYGKAAGLDRAGDALRHANMMGTHPNGGALALVGDDPIAKSSTVPSASEIALSDLLMPIFYPADSQEILDLGAHAIAMSRVSGLWSGVKLVTNVAEGAGVVEVSPDRVTPVVPTEREPYRHVVNAKLLGKATLDAEYSAHYVRLELARAYARANGINRIVSATGSARVGIIAAGKTYLDVRQAVSRLGLDDAALDRHGIRLLKLGLVFPLEPQVVREFARGLDEIIVVEEKRSFLETAVKDLLYGTANAPVVVGKRTETGDELFTSVRELDPDIIAAGVADRLARLDITSVRRWLQRRRPPARIPLTVVSRAPFYCSGCPHNRSVKVPEGTLVGAGTGCHGMAMLMDPDQVGEITGVTQMGGEGAQWIGMAPFLDRRHLVQNLGDGTFHHSASLAIRAAVAAGVDITFKLLYNSAVAMTGGQQAVGQRTVPQLTDLLTAEGVARIIVTTDEPKRYRRTKLARGTVVWHRDRLMEAQERLAAVSGVTVLIHDQECAAEKRRRRKREPRQEPTTRVLINERVCEGCGDCGSKSTCLSLWPVDTEFGRKTRIHQSSCNEDLSCLDGDCPSFVSVTASRRVRRPKTVPLPASLPDPLPMSGIDTDEVTIRLAGIGGTGVVTVAQILAVAAHHAGRHARTLDQTGLAQKGGAVVSDVKITKTSAPLANKMAAGECDLYIGCDLLVAANPANLAANDPRRTLAVVCTTHVPTGQMVTDPHVTFPDADDLTGAIDATTRAQDNVYLDARRFSEQLFGDDQYANVFLLGAAYQAGAVPLPITSIEEAIRGYEVAVERNLEALHRGRQSVADRAGLLAAVATPRAGVAVAPAQARAIAEQVGAEQGSELAGLVASRVGELVDYQDAAYARRYASVVARVRVVEESVRPGEAALAEAVARNLHKLMAYKDEYEVARLSLDPALAEQVRQQFGDGVRYSLRLHPPVLRALGMHRKIALGPWFRPALRVLRSLRRVRGTRLDVFGRTEVRRVERRLVEEYLGVVDELLAGLTDSTHTTAVAIAALPDLVRGYEQVKLDNVTAYRAALADLLATFHSPTPVGVELG
jgi:indolepyruvate ferredoxin oxidoreductase